MDELRKKEAKPAPIDKPVENPPPAPQVFHWLIDSFLIGLVAILFRHLRDVGLVFHSTYYYSY